jgi:hypothetical protein
MEKDESLKVELNHLMEMIKNLFKINGGKDSKPQFRNTNSSPEELDAFCHNLEKSTSMMKSRSRDLIKEGEYFKGFLVDARADQLDEMRDYFLDNEHPEKALDPKEMAKDLHERIEQRLDKIKGTKEHEMAQQDFARLQLTPDEMLKIDHDILSKHFKTENTADAALFRALNKSTESLAKGTIKPPKSRAEQAGLSISHPSIWDSMPPGVRASIVKTSVEEARAERAASDRPKNMSTKGDAPSGYEHASVMPPEPKM